MKINVRFVATLLAFGVSGAIVMGMSGCSTTMNSTEAPVGATTTTMAEAVSITDVWVKAVDDVSGIMPMTGYFMLVTNDSDENVTIVGGSAPEMVTADPLETHEVIESDSGEMVMQEARGGITIPAHSSVKLMPGGYHIMLMNLLTPVLAGDDLTISIEFSDGSSKDVTGVAYTIENGIEKYAPEASM